MLLPWRGTVSLQSTSFWIQDEIQRNDLRHTSMSAMECCVPQVIQWLVMNTMRSSVKYSNANSWVTPSEHQFIRKWQKFKQGKSLILESENINYIHLEIFLNFRWTRKLISHFENKSKINFNSCNQLHFWELCLRWTLWAKCNNVTRHG